MMVVNVKVVVFCVYIRLSYVWVLIWYGVRSDVSVSFCILAIILLVYR